MSLGDISHELGNESEAEWCYRKMLDQQPNNNVNTGILHYKIGKIQFEKKLYPEAFKNLIQAKSFFRQSEMKLNATTSLESTQRRYTELSLLKIYNDIGVMLEKKGKLKEAADRYEHALEEKSSDTDRAVAYRNFGHLHFRLGNYIKAKEHYEEARRLLDINHIWSQKFSSGLKRIIDYLAYNPDNEEHKRKKQKTNS
jgi:tetratricopeptide (TPR) repeat protein